MSAQVNNYDTTPFWVTTSGNNMYTFALNNANGMYYIAATVANFVKSDSSALSYLNSEHPSTTKMGTSPKIFNKIFIQAKDGRSFDITTNNYIHEVFNNFSLLKRDINTIGARFNDVGEAVVIEIDIASPDTPH